MCRVEALIVLPVTAFHLPIVTGRKGTDQLVADAVLLQTFLKKSGFVPMGGEPVRELGSVVCLDALDFAGECLYQMIHELGGRVGTVFFKSLYKTPSGILINGSVLEKLLSDDLAVFEAGGGNKFDVHLDALSRIVHLLIGFRNIFGVRGVDRHNALFSEEAVKAGNGTGIASLSELDPEDHKAGIRIAPAHMGDEFPLIGSMLVGMMVRPSGAIAQRVPGAAITAFPAVNILPVGLIFDSGFGDPILFSITNQG